MYLIKLNPLDLNRYKACQNEKYIYLFKARKSMFAIEFTHTIRHKEANKIQNSFLSMNQV